jgi:hypothetical protein
VQGIAANTFHVKGAASNMQHGQVHTGDDVPVVRDNVEDENLEEWVDYAK